MLNLSLNFSRHPPAKHVPRDPRGGQKSIISTHQMYRPLRRWLCIGVVPCDLEKLRMNLR